MILVLLDAFIMTGFGQQVMLGSPDSQTRYYSGSLKLNQSLSDHLVNAGVLLSNETDLQFSGKKGMSTQEYRNQTFSENLDIINDIL